MTGQALRPQAASPPDGASVLLVAVVGTIAAILNSAWSNFVALPTYVYRWPDVGYYILMAEGRGDEAIAPFASRLLVPFLARILSDVTSLSLLDSFFVLSCVSAAAFFAGAAALLARAGLATMPALMLLVLASPSLVVPFQYVYLPDAVSMALVALTLLALVSGRYAVLVPMAFVLMTTRESLAILVLMILWHLVAQRQRMWAAAVVAAALAGLATVQIFGGQPNAHGINPLFYMMLKLPVIAIENTLGAQFWLPDSSRITCDVPWLAADVSRIPLLGKIDQVGICTPSYSRIVLTYSSLFATFGVFPGAVIAWFVRRWQELWRERTGIFAATGFGLIMYALAICGGSLVDRLVIYAWPAFVIGSGMVWMALDRPVPWRARALLAMHMVLVWAIFLSDLIFIHSIPIRSLTLALGLVGNVLCWRYVARLLSESGRHDRLAQPATAAGAAERIGSRA